MIVIRLKIVDFKTTPSWCLKAIGEHELIFKLYLKENKKK
jgi:hypothetical protein